MNGVEARHHGDVGVGSEWGKLPVRRSNPIDYRLDIQNSQSFLYIAIVSLVTNHYIRYVHSPTTVLERQPDSDSRSFRL